MVGGARHHDISGLPVVPCAGGLVELSRRMSREEFLDLVRKWAPYELGEALAERFDEHFHVSAPLWPPG